MIALLTDITQTTAQGSDDFGEATTLSDTRLSDIDARLTTSIEPTNKNNKNDDSNISRCYIAWI